MAKHRIASLLPAATEIVCGLGCGDRLVARSHECDFPAGLQYVPVATRSRVDDGGTGAEIDAAVKDLAGQSKSVFEINRETLRETAPDTVIAQTLCDVCAVSDDDVRQAIADWPGKAPKVVSLQATKFAHLWDDITTIAAALNVKQQGVDYVKALKHRVVDVIEKACMASAKPRVLCVEWIDPLMAAGNWVPDLVGMAGAENLVGESGKHSGWIEMDAVKAAKPEIIVLMPCGFDLERTRKEAAVLADDPVWKKLKAVKRKQVFVVDGNAFFNRAGPRLVESLEILGEIFHPGLYDFGHEGTGWARL